MVENNYWLKINTYMEYIMENKVQVSVGLSRLWDAKKAGREVAKLSLIHI